MSVFGVILVIIPPYSVQIREKTDQNNSEYWHFLRSERFFIQSNPIIIRLCLCLRQRLQLILRRTT